MARDGQGNTMVLLGSKGWRRAARIALVGAATWGSAATAAGAQPATPIAEDALPRWQNLYDWPAGHGPSGWSSTTTAADLYALVSGPSAGAGLWSWPRGDASYRTGGAAWSYHAPGTTRVARATVRLTYPPRLLSHHCVRVSMLDGDATVDSEVFCKPPEAPGDSRAEVVVALDDPRATARRLVAGIEMPPCTMPNPDACARHIPAAPAEKNGLQVSVVDMTLVDDDLPDVSTAGEWHDLRDSYVDGRGSHPVSVAAADAGSGVAHLALERVGAGELAAADAGCDPRHRTPELGGRICPAQAELAAKVEATGLPEGRHDFRATARDVAGNAGATDSWPVFVDRTAPVAPELLAGGYDEANGQLYVTYERDEVVDPPLADGEAGSGVSSVTVRHRRAGDAEWSEWYVPATNLIEFDDVEPGQQVEVEGRAVDAVGNESTGSDTFTAEALHSDLIEVTDEEPELEEQDVPDERLRVMDYDPRYSPQRLQEDKQAFAAAKRPVPCGIGRQSQKAFHRDWGAEKDVEVASKAFLICPDPRAALGVKKMYVNACLQVRRPETGKFATYECDDESKSFKKDAIVLGRLDVQPWIMCRPGTRTYRLLVFARLTYHFPDPETKKKGTVMGYPSSTVDLPCNEAGAWRTVAQCGISSPSGLLGDRLRRRAREFEPTSGAGHWHAHHIVPAGYKSRANDAHALAYSCFFEPNQPENGVWLRARPLRAEGEARAQESTEAYKALPAWAKKRAYHPTIHTPRHFGWIADELRKAVDVYYGQRACKTSEADGILEDIKGRLKENSAPFRPEDDDPLESDD